MIWLMFCKHLMHFAWLLLWREMQEAFSNCINVAYTACLMNSATCGATYIQSTAGCECPNTESHEIASFLWNACLGCLIGMTNIWMSLVMAQLKCKEKLNRGYSPLQWYVFVILLFQLGFISIPIFISQKKVGCQKGQSQSVLTPYICIQLYIFTRLNNNVNHIQCMQSNELIFIYIKDSELDIELFKIFQISEFCRQFIKPFST